LNIKIIICNFALSKLLIIKIITIMKKFMFIVSILFVSSIAFAQEKPTYLCGQPTKAGHSCKNKVTESGAKCWMHGGATKTDVRMVAVQCSATAKSTGKQCRNKTTDKSGLCHVHNH
jgi:hypothetical protein